MGNMIQHWKQWEYNGIKHLPTGAGFLQQYVIHHIHSGRHNDLEIEFPKQMTVAMVAMEMLGLTLVASRFPGL